MAADSMMELKSARRRLARIRCIQDCIECFRCNKALPKAVCYIPARVEYKVTKNSKISLYEVPSKSGAKVVSQSCANDARIFASAEELCNSEGQWVKVLSYMDPKSQVDYSSDAWLLLYSAQSLTEECATFVPVSTPTSDSKKESNAKNGIIKTWEEVVEYKYSLHLDQEKHEVASADESAVQRMCNPPPNWSLEHDEDLTVFLRAHVETEAENLGCIKNYVESVDVSSYCEDDAADNLTDGDTDTYWESDGSQGQHWIRLRMKKGTIIKRLFITVDANDDNYMPYRIMVMGGELDSLRKLNEVTVDQSLYGTFDVTVLEDQREHHPIIEIRIKECKDDGIDTRIRGIKIKSIKERDLGLSRDNFSPENLVRYPKLECYSPDVLYRRALLLQRFIKLLDSVLPYIVPAWEYSVGSYSSLEVVRQFLLLSKKRVTLAETLLRESETCRPSRMPKLYINRRAASEHKADPSKDRDYKNTVFSQIYEGLKPRDRAEKPLDYRWPARHDQWWECKFLAEGIIDQGGGFRDSLSDLADEMCPSAPDVPVPLPFFIRSPNQNQMDANINRDVYIPNPANRELHKFEWIGKLMGACIRGKESLVLSLPSFVWKKLAGERVTWSRDYITVDEAEVKLIENLDGMDEMDFGAYFGSGGRTWSCTLSDGTVVPLKPDGENIPVLFEERHEYGQAVIETRMQESSDQTEALRQGLLQVVPQAFVDLLTWQELERVICGDPEVSVEALKRTTHYDDVEEADQRVKTFWEALTRFSNEDRSRFLRFVTGRRRLPAPLIIYCEKGDAVDALPESSTCSNTLYLPRYSSVKVAEEKLRYAAYNCIAIDTDMNPWGE